MVKQNVHEMLTATLSYLVSCNDETTIFNEIERHGKLPLGMLEKWWEDNYDLHNEDE
jgi:hypothetical protein